MSCGPSLRVRLRRDADALQHARANTEPDDTLADAQACATADNAEPDDTLADAPACETADVRARLCRAGRCAVGCVSTTECA
jgi:hypothetical protein